MPDTFDLPALLVLLGAIMFGVLVTVLVQIAASFRALTHELTDTSRRMRDVAETLQPVATRLKRLSALAEDSEPDLKRLQLAVRGFANSARRASNDLDRVTSAASIVIPVAVAVAKRWIVDQESKEHPEQGADDGRVVAASPTNGATSGADS